HPHSNFPVYVLSRHTLSDRIFATPTPFGTVTITQINDAMAVNDTKSVAEDAELTFPATDLLANDSDADGDPLTVISVGTAGNGTIGLSNVQITYTPNLNNHASDSISYTISD